MGLIGKFNNLHKQVKTRKEIQELFAEAIKEEQPEVVFRLGVILMKHPEAERFRVKISCPAIEVVPESFLHCLDCENDLDDKIAGLGKAVSPNDIYQMITDKMIQLIKKANVKDFKIEWETKTYGSGYLLPFNFVTKKMYRGVNRFLLAGFEPLENPFFLTFKQVDELKGKVKKGAKGHEVVYFTNLYIYQNSEKKINISSYDLKKFIALLQEHGLPTNNPNQYALPILKYYKVFNGKDIEGIDFDLENFKHGYIDNPRPAADENRMPIAEAIIKYYPTPAPQLISGGSGASYSSRSDILRMPHLEDFNTVQAYYNVYFHELSHSTGHVSRLNRKLGNKFGSKDYAFEELIAEFGATFLSAEAGIIWHTNLNHAAYLKSWNSKLTFMQDDNRFFMRAATQAQKVADFVLQYDAAGNPKYFADLKKDTEPKKKAKKVIKAKTKPVKKLTKEELAKVNPEPFANKPKSVSVATAIKDVISLKQNKGINQQQAQILYKYFKDGEFEKDVTLSSNFEKGFMRKATPFHYEWDNDISLTPYGEILIQSINGRLESLKNQKTNYSMFDGLKRPKTQKKAVIKPQGLKAAIPEVIEPVNEVPEQVNEPVTQQPVFEIPAPVVPAVKKNPLVKKIGEKSSDSPSQFFTVAGEVGKFLQRVERKPVHSVVVTMDGEQGAGKTTTLFKFMDAFASPGNSCLFISGEEHQDSGLITDKVKEYLSPEAVKNTDIVSEVKDIPELYELISDYDIICIDSWQKLVRMVGNVRLDEDLRKKFNGKVFVIIFQQTTTGRTKGGSEVVFDGDIITKMVKCASFADNYAFFDKNRYTLVPIETLRYNIATGTVYNPESEPECEPEAEAPEQKPKTELQFNII